MADISQFFDKSYEQQEFKALADAPVEAIQGLSESDAGGLKSLGNRDSAQPD
jgi:antitoxin component HigA of HigAB toxin-antitoxin module